MWSNKEGGSVGLLPGRQTLGPLFLLLASPVFVIGVLYRTLRHLDGSILALLGEWRREGFLHSLHSHWPEWRDPEALSMIGAFLLLQLAIVRLVPGRTHHGPVTPAGNVPVYNANGFQAFLLTTFLFFLGVLSGAFHGGIVYDKLGELLASANVLALVLCALLYLKGILAPSSSDCGSSGNPIFDYYWGTELYPRIAGFDVKQMTNCRMGMMFWAVFLLSAVCKQYESTGQLSDSLAVNVLLQLLYVCKFFWWESGYYNTIDISHDRAGFYLCWGCLCFLPCVYVSHTLFLVAHPLQLGDVAALALLAGGALSILINYDSDRQRQAFRAAGGKLSIWGSPAVFITAKYRTEEGEERNSILLTSGYWGLSRHFNYLPEVAAAAAWAAPVLWARHWTLAFFYVPYLALLLIDRAFRDDARCRAKYGRYWAVYCKAVPAMLIPGIL